MILDALKKRFYSYYTKRHGLIQKPRFEQVPQVEVSYAWIENARLLATREQLLSFLPTGGVVAELGVDRGGFSQNILEINQPKKLHLVDVWQSTRYPEELFHEVKARFQEEISDGKVEINQGLSTEVVTEFPDGYFDWIYIDTAHTYSVTKAELEAYLPKMKLGGVIAGHDFIVGEIDVPWRYGVIEAVYEFCGKYGWEIIYLTMERGISPSFAIKAK